MSKFTPGPWSFSECENGIEYEVNANKWGICIVAGGHPDEAEEANAALIADAPELLEALEKCLDAFDAEYPPFEAGIRAQNDWSLRKHNAREQARTLIAKHRDGV